MYKLLLSWRYLRSRWIALASIISVTLGVATMIIVNSVMEGFTREMHNRLHGILSDLVLEGHGNTGLADAGWHEAVIREILGDDLVGITSAVRVPAMVNFQVRGQWITQQIMLIGIDDKTYANVSDFSQYLLHPENRKKVEFTLREEGYDAPCPPSGWLHRRLRASYEQAFLEQKRQVDEQRQAQHAAQAKSVAGPAPIDVEQQAKAAGNETAPSSVTNDPASVATAPTADPFQRPIATVDPFGAANAPPPENVFDEMKDQHTGIVLGIAITSVRHRGSNGKVQDFFLARPGDDVMITFPNAGQPPKAVSDRFTIVDVYESKMSEYDSTFAFVPISRLQDMRGMIDPLTGTASVTSIQMKLRPGADLNVARDKLRARFPVDQFSYRIETWRDMQGPLLAAVKMETTILNILLFLIIAVAGFGILATFFMIVVEKTRDIGILKALGAPSGGVMSIFLNYGLALGVVGSGAGMVLGLLFVHYINDIAKLLEWISGREVFDPTIYYFQKIPTIIQPLTVGWVVMGAILIAVAAAVLPALRPLDYTPWRLCAMSKVKSHAAKNTSPWQRMTNPVDRTLLRDGQPATVASRDKNEPGTALLSAHQLKKSYCKGKIEVPVLRGVDFEAHLGQFTAIVGQSGSGKSTLLHLLGTLDAPDAGEIHFEGKRIDNLPSKSRDRLRNHNFGMIFQFYHLLPELNMLENVLVPAMITEGVWSYWRNKKRNTERATKLLEMVGLGHRLKHKPRELSGGEMQRTAIARALITEPQVLLADEPTGNLDRQTGREILEILRTLNAEHNLTIIMVTHDNAIAAQADRTVRLVEGHVEHLS